MFEDRVADAFVSHLTDVFQREGYRGQIIQLAPTDREDPRLPLISVNLIEWRGDRTGRITCMFGANLVYNGASHHLGTFNGMALRWMNGPGRFGVADTFGDAADDAVRDLYRALTEANVIPGVTRR